MTMSLVILALLFCTPTFAATFTGQVVAITDGDTITVFVSGRQVKVRLYGIDAPERKQPFGVRSRQYLSDLCFQKKARVDDLGRDRHGRVVGRVVCAGKDTSVEMIRAGMTWVFDGNADSHVMYRRYLYRLEDSARTGRRGLWADQKPIPPWEWRKWKRKK